MKEIIISTLDMARLRSHIDKARSGGIQAPIDLNPLIDEIERAEVVAPDKMPSDIVTMNSIVKLQYVNSNQTIQIQIVYPEDADTTKQKISVFAPVGTALLGYRKGDIVHWMVPDGEVELRIEEIIYQPEAAGDMEI